MRSYLARGLSGPIGADELNKLLEGVLSRVVVVADGWVGEVRAGLLDDGRRREVERRGGGSGTS